MESDTTPLPAALWGCVVFGSTVLEHTHFCVVKCVPEVPCCHSVRSSKCADFGGSPTGSAVMQLQLCHVS